MSYTKTTWVNDSLPAINAENLNKIEDGVKQAVDGVENLKYYINWEDFSSAAGINAEITKAVGLKKFAKDRVTVVFYGNISTTTASFFNAISFVSDMNYINTSASSSYAAQPFILTSLSNVRFENFTFEIGQASTNATLNLIGCHDIEFISCIIKNQILYPLNMSGCYNIYFENCVLTGNSMPSTGHTACVEISGSHNGWVMFQSCILEKSRGYILDCSVSNADHTISLIGCLVDGTTNTPVELTDIKNTGTAKILVSTVNIPSPTTATQGQFLVADGQGGASWTTVPSAETQNV